MKGGLKRQLNLLAVGIILAVSVFISLAAVIAMDRLAHQLSEARILSELSWIRFDVGDAHRILKDTGVDTLKSYIDSAQQEIIQKFQDFRIGNTGRLYLVSDDGRIVSTPSDRQAADLDGPALELVTREKVGHAKLKVAGSPSIVYFDNFPEWGWRILLVISEKEINAERDNFILIAIVILLFSACTGVVIFARVANGFVLPILELAEKLSGMKEDQLGQQLAVKHHSKEVGVLLSAFSRLSDRLLAAKNTLQEQNEELQVRKKELQSQNDELILVEAMLRQSEQRHRSILQTAMDGILFLDNRGRFLEVNETYCRMSGYSMQELLTMSIADVESLETASDTAAHIKKVIAQGEDRFESKHRRKDGSIYDVEVSVQYRPSDGGQLVVFLQDITERKRAEEALRRSEKDLRESQRIAHVGSWRLDVKTNQVVWTEELYYMYGFDPSLPPPPYTEHMKLFTPESWERLSTALACTRDTGIPYTLELETVRKDGSNGWLWVRGEADVDPAGKTVELWGAAQDITERKQAEAEREKLQAQLTQAQKMESVGRLAGGVAHDFNNMLGVILGHTEMALEKTYPESPIHAGLQAIHQAAQRSAALTRQLLAFASKQTVAPRVIDINDAVEGMLKMLRRLIGEDIDLLWRPGANLPRVKVDPAQIDQLLANLCVNARDAINGVGKITIETDTKTLDEANCADHLGSLPGEYLLLEVSDDGSGMDQETLSHIFEPFFTTKEQGKGTGLGLASVFGMVKQNNGFIDVESEPGQGTTFKIYMPAIALKSAGVTEKASELPAERGSETILLVEDEPAILQMTTMMLTRLGYTVVAAATPGEAIRLALAYRGKIDLLMTDVVMPEMNGRDLAVNLLSHYPDLKRLFMSGYTADIIANQGVLDEGVHFIQKPFSMKDLGGKLRETLDG